MFYLGIDIGKNTHVASLIDDKKKVIFKAFSFSNSIDGANSLLEKLSPFIQSLEIGMEATGHYWLSIYSFLVEKNLSVHVINPIQTDGWRNGIEIRKRKTDIIDSIVIADLLRYGDFLETSLSNEDYLSLRNLTRFRSYLISSVSDLKRKTIAVLDQVFPEYASSFSNIFCFCVLSSFLYIAIFFIYLLIIYPVVPRRDKEKRWPTCKGHRFFFLHFYWK